MVTIMTPVTGLGDDCFGLFQRTDADGWVGRFSVILRKNLVLFANLGGLWAMLDGDLLSLRHISH